jgi:uncharacterized paraquat-inducible protein A
MADITCPECGTVTDLPAIRRSADEFCRHCDYPLFWTPSAVPTTTPGGNADTTLRRLPGAGGRQRVGSKVCPECGELNSLRETHCTRCGADLDPKPPEPEPEPVVFAPEPEPLPVPIEREPSTPWWVYWLGLTVLVTLIFIIGLLA